MKKQVNFKVAITVMYPRIPCEMVTDPLGSAQTFANRCLSTFY